MGEPVSSGQLWSQTLAQAAKGSAMGPALPWPSAPTAGTGMPRIGSGPQGWPAFEPTGSRTVKVRSCHSTPTTRSLVHAISVSNVGDQQAICRRADGQRKDTVQLIQ